MTRFLSGVRELAGDFDHFIVDLWGVIHDGSTPYEGVRSALEELRDAGRQVVFVTNASRTHGDIADMLVQRLGIARDLFHAVVSSGDVTRQAIVGRDPALFQGVPPRPRCLHLGAREYVPWLFELGLDFVDAPRDADVIFATGTMKDEAALRRSTEGLDDAVARDVPLVCTNPDRIVPTPKGFTLGPGAVAHAYAQLGGRTFLYGKPHAPIYTAALASFGRDVARSRVVALGDTLETDIRGARDAGLSSVLVVDDGVHRGSFPGGVRADEGALHELARREGVRPDMALARFSW